VDWASPLRSSKIVYRLVVCAGRHIMMRWSILFLVLLSQPSMRQASGVYEFIAQRVVGGGV
jgi:hypothetical protein